MTGEDAVHASVKILADRLCRPFEPLKTGSVSFLSLDLKLAWFERYVKGQMKTLERFITWDEVSLDQAKGVLNRNAPYDLRVPCVVKQYMKYWHYLVSKMPAPE